MATLAHNRPCTRILISTITCTGALVMLHSHNNHVHLHVHARTRLRLSSSEPLVPDRALSLQSSSCYIVCVSAIVHLLEAALLRLCALGRGGSGYSVWLLCMCVCNCDWVTPCVSVRVLARNTAEASWGYTVLAAVAKNGRSSEIV